MKRLFLLSCLLLLSMPVFAHLAGVTDTSIRVTNTQITLVYTVPADTLKELNANTAAEITQAIQQGFVVKNNETVCPVQSIQTRSLGNIASEQFEMRLDCAAPIEVLTVAYRLFIDQFPDHENFTRLSIANRSQSFVFSAAKRHHQLPVAAMLTSWQQQAQQHQKAASDSVLNATQYFPLGVEHILLGFDHLLFLLALLLLPLGLKPLLGLITSFTLAHSITLALSVLNIVSLPALWVEVAIAFSIVYVAVENLYELHRQHQQKPVSPWKRRLGLTFLFGLIHGFGFSYVLKEIGLGDQVAGALLFFNLGVEAGQLLAILLILPLLWVLFKQQHQKVYLQAGSVVIGLIGGFWFVQRLI